MFTKTKVGTLLTATTRLIAFHLEDLDTEEAARYLEALVVAVGGAKNHHLPVMREHPKDDRKDTLFCDTLESPEDDAATSTSLLT